jgi:hypothetical protein
MIFFDAFPSIHLFTVITDAFATLYASRCLLVKLFIRDKYNNKWNHFNIALVASTAIDLIIVAFAKNRNYSIYTRDKDFWHYRTVWPLEIYQEKE